MKRKTTNINRTVRPLFYQAEFIAWLRERSAAGKLATDDEIREYVNEIGSDNAVNNMSLWLLMGEIMRDQSEEANK